MRILWLALIFAPFWSHGQDSVKIYRNSFEIGGRLESYKDPYKDRTYAYFQYGRKFKSVDYFARLLHYSVGSNNAFMVESDVYWKFKKNGYSFFNAGYSDSELLPNYRLRAEVYRNYKRWEYSLGAGLVKPKNYDVIPMVTGTIGYYFGNYFVYARPTLSFVDDGVAKSLFLSGRHYFSKTDYLEASFLKGEDTGAGRNFSAVENSFGLDTYLIRLSGRMKRGKYKFGMGVDYGGLFIPQRDEYAKFVGVDVFINREF